MEHRDIEREIANMPPLGRDPQPSPELLAKLERTLATDLRPVKPLRPAWQFAAVWCAIFLALVIAGAVKLEPLALPEMGRPVSILVLGVLAICVGGSVLSLARQMTPGSRYRFPPGLLPFAALIVLAVMFFLLFPIESRRCSGRRAGDVFGRDRVRSGRRGTPLVLLAARGISRCAPGGRNRRTAGRARGNRRAIASLPHLRGVPRGGVASGSVGDGGARGSGYRRDRVPLHAPAVVFHGAFDGVVLFGEAHQLQADGVDQGLPTGLDDVVARPRRWSSSCGGRSTR